MLTERMFGASNMFACHSFSIQTSRMSPCRLGTGNMTTPTHPKCHNNTTPVQPARWPNTSSLIIEQAPAGSFLVPFQGTFLEDTTLRETRPRIHPEAHPPFFLSIHGTPSQALLPRTQYTTSTDHFLAGAHPCPPPSLPHTSHDCTNCSSRCSPWHTRTRLKCVQEQPVGVVFLTVFSR